MVETQRLLDIFFNLVAIDATSKSEKPVADFIREFVKPYKIKAFEDKAGIAVDGNTGNMILKINSEWNIEPIALLAHMDTVKSTLGIKPRLENGKIITDGTTILGADNRAGIAIILTIIEYLKLNSVVHRPFEVIFTIGEETGLFGSTHLDLDIVKSRTAYILDSSADPGGYVYHSPEAREFEIRLLGKASHAAVHPDQGINALSMAGKLISRFQVGQVDQETTINFGKISGGEANNVIPPQVNISGEIRSFSKSKIDFYTEDLIKQLGQIGTEFGGSYQFNSQSGFLGFEIDLHSSAIKQLDHCLRLAGLTPQPLKYHGGSDANVLNNRGMTAIDLGIGAKNPHSVDEYIAVKDLEVISKVIFYLLTCRD